MAKASHSKDDDDDPQGRSKRSAKSPRVELHGPESERLKLHGVDGDDAASPGGEQLGLDDFEQAPRDEGLSLDELSQAYAKLLASGAEPYEAPRGQASSGADDPRDEAAQQSDRQRVVEQQTGAAEEAPPAFEPAAAAEHDPADDACELSPRSILEAMLFVGHPQNEPLSSREVAALMRGVRPAEIDELVRDLNALYDAEGCPYTIVSQGAGYRLSLRPQFDGLRDRFYGRIREARLSQAAIDTLAIVAYNQPVSRDDVERLRGKPSGSILLQLVRRELLRIERPEQRPRKPRYFTTERFLDVFRLENLDDLPQSQELEK